MAAHRYWRIRNIDIPANYLEISELQLYQGATRVDGSATLTCSDAPGFGTLAQLKDGDLGTNVWWPIAVAGSSTFWLQWDFGSPQVVDGIKQGGWTVADYRMRGCSVEYSDNGSTWVGVARLAALPYPGSSVLSATYSLPADGTYSGSFRYWRLVATAVDGSTSHVSAAEIELLGLDGTDYTTGRTSSASQTGDSNVGSAGSWVDDNQGSEGGSSFPLPYTWTIDLGSARTVATITLMAQRVVPNRTPKDFTIQGSADGATWSTVLTVVGAAGWTEFERRTWANLSYTIFVLSGVVKNSFGVGVARTVRAHKRSTGQLMTSAISASDGTFSLVVPDAAEYYVLAVDDTENAVVLDHLTPAAV